MDDPRDRARDYLDRRTSIAVLATVDPDGNPEACILIAPSMQDEDHVEEPLDPPFVERHPDIGAMYDRRGASRKCSYEIAHRHTTTLLALRDNYRG